MIEVAAGILVRDGRILLQQRPASKDFAYRWECPGGKVEAHESHHSALARELKEELGLEVLKAPDPHVADFYIGGRAIWCGDVGSEAHGKVFILFYLVPAFMGEPTPREGQGWGWFTEKELRTLWVTPGNEAAVAAICRAVWPNARGSGCGMSWHHHTCDCGGVGGDR